MNKRGIVCNEECSKYIMDLTTKIEAQEGLISDLECDVHFWKTKFEDLNAEYNLLLARNNVLEEMLTNERIETGGTMYLLEKKVKELECQIEVIEKVSDFNADKVHALGLKLDAVNPLPDKWRGEWIVRSQDRTENEQAYVDGRLKSANELDKAIGEQK